MRYRVNTPGPSFTVEAENINQATSEVVGKRGFPSVDFDHGDVVVEFERVRGDKQLRYVHLWRHEDLGAEDPSTGFVIYREL